MRATSIIAQDCVLQYRLEDGPKATLALTPVPVLRSGRKTYLIGSLQYLLFVSVFFLMCVYVCVYQTADDVFMSNNAERQEYVEEDSGIIYVGSTNRIGMVGWNFGQVKGP